MSQSRSLTTTQVGAVPANPAEITFEQLDRLAGVVADAGVFGIKSKQAALALMLMAQAEGRHPMMVAQDYDIVEGKPALKAEKVLARFQASGGKVEWRAMTDKIVTGFFSHPKGSDVEISWTMEDAGRIKYFSKGGSNSQGGWKPLAQKHNWQSYPRQMLRARVIGEGIRACYPGAVSISLTAEEASDPTLTGDGGDTHQDDDDNVTLTATMVNTLTDSAPGRFVSGDDAMQFLGRWQKDCDAAGSEADIAALYAAANGWKGKISNVRHAHMLERVEHAELRIAAALNAEADRDYAEFQEQNDATNPPDRSEDEKLFDALKERGVGVMTLPVAFRRAEFDGWVEELKANVAKLNKERRAELQAIWGNVRDELEAAQRDDDDSDLNYDPKTGEVRE